MESRYRIQNTTHFIEAPKTKLGKTFLENIRLTKQGFKRRRIREVIQAYPSMVTVGVLYELT